MIILVGNKLDLVQNNPNLRQVNNQEARQFADENNILF